jgi:hypothetical protein
MDTFENYHGTTFDRVPFNYPSCVTTEDNVHVFLLHLV